ncbi:MAG: 16S rRNA (cytosine(1402)-N(4))-methyltransferase RsmH [Candidatus Sumerlaeota bacterium]
MVEYHIPVMLEEVRSILQPRRGEIIVDMNLGTGGHSLALLEDCGGECFLVGLDLDPQMLSLARQRLDSHGISPSSYALVHADHADVSRVMGDLGLDHADRILMDLGASSLHFDLPARGFSCQHDGPLDMRYNTESGPQTAADIVNTWDVGELAELFKRKGDERWAKRIAGRIVEMRQEKPFETTGELAEAVAGAIPRKAWPPKIHPATRVFLALRVEVNAEDRSLREGLKGAVDILRPGGRFAVLTFQSHEDRTVKHTFRGLSRDEIDETDPWGRVKTPAVCKDLTRKPLRPSEAETAQNARARSVKLRAIEKLETRED